MRVVSGLMFFPRGGSAHVARNLARELPAHGWDVTVVSGSGSGHGDAAAFYSGLDVHAVDFERGDAPQHPSYEDRPDAPDRVFATIDDVAYERHVRAWAAALDRAGAAEADVLHLHHLTPLNEAAARVAPGVPVVGHLHGTELSMLERALEDPPGWAHAQAWVARMRRWAERCTRLLVLTETQVERAVHLLGIAPELCAVASNGFDPELFAPRSVNRAAVWRRHLVDAPRGWRPGQSEGSVAYLPADAEAIARGPVLVAVGRFTEVKRTALMVRAFAQARSRFEHHASLVFVGGYPGEWEGEHPHETIRSIGAGDVYLAGWHDHTELPLLLAAADAVVLASVREQFGLVLVEGMACGLPAIAVDRYGPAGIVDPGRTGWLVEPDDERAFAAAMVEAVNRPAQRNRFGAAAMREAHERYAWPVLAEHLSNVLEDAAAVGTQRLAGAGER